VDHASTNTRGKGKVYAGTSGSRERKREREAHKRDGRHSVARSSGREEKKNLGQRRGIESRRKPQVDGQVRDVAEKNKKKRESPPSPFLFFTKRITTERRGHIGSYPAGRCRRRKKRSRQEGRYAGAWQDERGKEGGREVEDRGERQ